MRDTLLLLAAGFVLAAGAALPPAAAAADKPNVLLMGEDGDRDTVPCSSRVFKRALNALSNQVSEEGFEVFDETTASLGDFAQGHCRRSDAELTDIARSIRTPPVDVVVIFSVYASAEQLTYTTKVRDRVMGRLLDIRSGKRLGSFEVKSPGRINAPADCPRDCLLEVVGDETRILAQDLGAALGAKLRAHLAPAEVRTSAAQPGGSQSGLVQTAAVTSGDATLDGLSTAFVLVFDAFKPEEVTQIEEYLVSFQGYEHHRPTRCSIRRCEYWYETSSRSARLNRNLRRMMDYLGVRGRVSISGNNTFLVEKVAALN